MKSGQEIKKALECCRDIRNPPGYRFLCCDDCPYQKEKNQGEKYYNCINRMLEDAAEKLDTYHRDERKMIMHNKDRRKGGYSAVMEVKKNG